MTGRKAGKGRIVSRLLFGEKDYRWRRNDCSFERNLYFVEGGNDSL